MNLTPFVIVSVALQAALLTFFEFAMPRAQPQTFQRVVVYVGTIGALLFTSLNIPLYHLVLYVSPLVVFFALVLLAVVPPIAGLIEESRDPGVFTKDRFVSHLATNIFGAVATAAFIWVGHRTPGFDTFTVEFKSEAAFNIVLPMTTAVILAYVRWQQINAYPALDRSITEGNSDWVDGIKGFSLRHIHQLTNAIYLIVVTFMGAGMILYLFAYTLEQAKAGQPLALTWQLVGAIVTLLAFLFACGLPGSRKHRAVYLTFLTGTPAAMLVSVVWLALLQESTARNLFALGIIVVGYVLYCAQAVLGSRTKDDDTVQLHYFSAAAFAVSLTMLAGALYFS